MVVGSEFSLTLDSCGLSLLARDFVMVAVKKYTLLLWVECPSAHTLPCKQNLLVINAKSLSRFPGFLIQLASLQMASLALRTLRIAARNQQPLFYIAQVKSDIKEVTKSLPSLFIHTKNHFYSSPHFYSFFVQGRQLSTSSYEFIKTDLAGTENRWSRDTSKVSQRVKCHPFTGWVS